MKHEYLDWQILRGALIIFLASLLAGSLLIGGSWYFKKEMLVMYNESNRQFQAISRQYLTVDQEEQQIKEYHPEFLALFERGIIGREHRLNWVETLRAANDQIKLPALKYEISSQDEYSPEFSINSGNFKIYTSEMKLRLDLLHEGDLLKVLNELDRKAAGIYTISGCKLIRSSGDIIETAIRANISAECELQWFNIRQADGSEIKKL